MQEKEESFEIEIKNLGDYQTDEIIGSLDSLVALKSKDSYLIATKDKGILVIEDKHIVYKKSLPRVCKGLIDAVYVETLKSYFFCNETQIYKKGANSAEPVPFLEISCSGNFGKALRYSKVNQKLIVVQDFDEIAVVNLFTRKIEIELEKLEGNEIVDFSLFGSLEERLIALTHNGWISLFNYKIEKLGKESRLKIPFWRMETADALTVCSQSRYFCVALTSLTEEEAEVSSRIAIYEVQGNIICFRGALDLLPQELSVISSLTFVGYLGSQLVFLALECGEGTAHLFGFEKKDPTNKLVTELTGLKVKHEELNPCRPVKLGGEFVYVGFGGQLLSLSFKREDEAEVEGEEEVN